MPDSRQNYVGGAWQECDSGNTFEDGNPAATDGVMSVHQRSDEEDAGAAVEAAEAADDWAETPGPERGASLRKVAALTEDREEDLAATLTREEGKTFAES